MKKENICSQSIGVVVEDFGKDLEARKPRLVKVLYFNEDKPEYDFTTVRRQDITIGSPVYVSVSENQIDVQLMKTNTEINFNAENLKGLYQLHVSYLYDLCRADFKRILDAYDTETKNNALIIHSVANSKKEAKMQEIRDDYKADILDFTTCFLMATKLKLDKEKKLIL